MKLPIKNLDQIQIIGFIISIIVSVSLLLMGQDEVSSITLGFVLAALTQLFDLQKRTEDSEERLLKASSLSQELYRNEWLFDHLQQIVHDYKIARSTWFELFRLRADEAIIHCRKSLHSMAEGYLITESGGPYAHERDMFMRPEKVAKAVAAIDESYWRTPEANIYVQTNAEFVEQGVRFIRIFTYPKSILYGMIDILEKQQILKIEVYVVPSEMLPKELNEDYIIIDDKMIARTEQIGQQQKISIDKVEIEEMVRRFDALHKYARKLSDVIEEIKN